MLLLLKARLLVLGAWTERTGYLRQTGSNKYGIGANLIGHVLERDIEYQTHVLNLRARQILENGNQIRQFIVVSITEPAADRDGVLWVEDVAGGGVVDDDGFAKISADLAEIFDVVALVVVAALTEQTVLHDAVDVQLIHERIAVLRNRGGENDHFVELANALEERIYSGSFDDVDIVVLAFDLDGYRDVCLVKNLLRRSAWCEAVDLDQQAYLETAVHQSFVEIQHETLSSAEFRLHRR